MKSCRNSVAVPRHWSYKRKYLSGKRGIEKPPFELPEFIKKTGIMEMREALQQKEQEQSMKTKMRQRVRPKLGKIDIDYQKLHDAFFRYQTKPKMSRHGDIYYEVINIVLFFRVLVSLQNFVPLRRDSFFNFYF
jgi:splicing factor 3B subunit 2